MIVATRPEPTVLPPSRSDLVAFRNLFVTVFAVLWLILWVFYLLFYLFPGEMLQIRITDFGKNLNNFCPCPNDTIFVHLGDIVTWTNRNVNWFFAKFVRPSLISGRVGERNHILLLYHASNELGWTNKLHVISVTARVIHIFLFLFM